MLHLLPYGLALFLLVGCATNVPEAIRKPAPGDLTVAEARTQPSAHVGRQVRWGGTIAAVENHKTETWLEVVSRELDNNARPRETDRSAGRFLVRADGFLDPAVYAKGRQVTVSGTVEGGKTRPIGEFSYHYPVVKARAVHLWEPLPELRRDYRYHDPFWSPWYPWHHRYPYW